MSSYYKLDGKKYNKVFDLQSKLLNSTSEAILHLGDEFNEYDWTKYPIKSLTELEDELVLKIASLGRPINILYTGGTDSYSVATAFARNGINVKYSAGRSTIYNSKSLIHVSNNKILFSYLNDLHEKYNLSKPDINLIELNENLLNEYYSDPYFYEKGHFYGTAGGFHPNMHLENIRFESGDESRYIHITGNEKPRLYINDIGIFWQLTDTMLMYGKSLQYDSIWFYTNSLSLELIAKQCWNVIDYLFKTFPKADIKEELHKLQTDPSLYHLWNVILERRPTEEISFFSRVVKPVGNERSYESKRLFPYIDKHKELNTVAWRNFQNLYHTLGVDKLPSITTDRFYLKYWDKE